MRAKCTPTPYFNLKLLPASNESCLKRLYQPGCAAGRSLSMRVEGRLTLGNDFLIMMVRCEYKVIGSFGTFFTMPQGQGIAHAER